MNRRRRALLTLVALAALSTTVSACDPSVPMGTGRNFLGTSDNNDNGAKLVGPLATSVQDQYWLSIGGYCQRREWGDLITSYADNNGDTGAISCQPASEGGPAYVRYNPHYDPTGYHYLITIPEGSTAAQAVQVYDPGYCTGNGYPDGSNTSGQRTTFTLVAPDLTTPLVSRTWDSDGGAGVDVSSCTVGTASGARSWYTLATITEPGTYHLRVTAPAPTVKTTSEGNNHFALRVGAVNAFSPCSNDTTQAPVGTGIAFDPLCPAISALGAMGMYVDLSGSSPVFRIGPTPPGSDGETFHVELFDAAEGSLFVELLNPLHTISSPNGVTFTAEVSCQDGTYQSETGIDCPTATGETPPTPVNGSTYGPWTTNKLDVCGPKPACGATPFGGGSSTADAAAQPWGFGHAFGRTQYNNRTIRLSTSLPADLAAAYGPNTIWSIRYTTSSSGANDRLTMKATVS